MIDTSGILEFGNLLESLTKKNCRMLLSGVQKSVQAKLEKSGFVQKLGAENIFWDARAAIKAAGQD